MKRKLGLPQGSALFLALSLSACSENLFKAEETEEKAQASQEQDSEKMTYAQTADMLLTNLVGEKSSQNYESKSAVYASRLSNTEIKKGSSNDTSAPETASADGDEAGAGAPPEGRRIPAGDGSDPVASDDDGKVGQKDSDCKEITNSDGTVEYYCAGGDVDLPPGIDDCVEDVINYPEEAKEDDSQIATDYREPNSIGRCHWIEPVMPDPGFCGKDLPEPIAVEEVAIEEVATTTESSSEAPNEVVKSDKIESGDEKDYVYIEPMECSEPIKEKVDQGQEYSQILKDVLIQLLSLFDDDMDGKLDKIERKEAVTVILKAMLD
jgi:hypothetical protein